MRAHAHTTCLRGKSRHIWTNPMPTSRWNPRKCARMLAIRRGWVPILHRSNIVTARPGTEIAHGAATRSQICAQLKVLYRRVRCYNSTLFLQRAASAAQFGSTYIFIFARVWLQETNTHTHLKAALCSSSRFNWRLQKMIASIWVKCGYVYVCLYAQNCVYVQ